MESKNVRIIFFIPNECESEHDTSEEMQQAYKACKQNSIKVQWIPVSDYKLLTLNKTDVTVFQNFEGTCFDNIRSSKSVRIVGPWCLLTCVTQGIHIPNFPWPIYSVAMRDCTVSTSAIPKAQRMELRNKIEQMGGFYSPDLVRNCTHLVTDSVKSEKYIKAAETGLKILLPSWVHDVWDASCKGTIHCNDNPFLSKHCCPTFHKLVICCTGLNASQRIELSKLIEEHGGTYSEQMHIASTDILVCNSDTTSSKFIAAKKRNIKCVTLDWVKDSIKNGYAMPDAQYSVTVSTSTPTKDARGIQPNFSMISNITTATSQLALANDTIEGTFNISMPPPQMSKKRKSDSNEHNELVDGINMQNVKMAGPFLDGCGIYLAGFGIEQREKLCKILNFGGATRYDDISERVTHVIVGNTSCHDLKLLSYKDPLKTIPILSIHWLLDSLIAEHPVNEEKYIINASDLTRPDSPLSKKALHLMRQNSSSQERISYVSEVEVPDEEVDVAKQYLQANDSVQEDTLAKLLQNVGEFNSKQDTAADEKSKSSLTSEKRLSVHEKNESLSSAVDDSSQHAEPIFQGLKFIIAGFAEDTSEQVRDAIEEMHGKVMSKLYNGISDYAVVPVFSKLLLKRAATHIVTDLWITECWQENEVRPVEYFHMPISVKEGVHPLKGCVITISNYVNYERNFLRNLIKELGGICQEQLSKITCSKTGVVACTHLVTPDAVGKKYSAAIKWKMFIVNKDWLLECARTSKREPEALYSVGDATCLKNIIATSEVRLETPSKSYIDNTKAVTIPTVIETPKPIQTTYQSPIQITRVSDDSDKPMPVTTVQSNNSLSSVDQIPRNRILHSNIENIGHESSPITPVSKIIAEAHKKHLLGTCKQSPLRVLQNLENTENMHNVTPVHGMVTETAKTDLVTTPESVPYPKPWDHVDTPDTPLGAFIRPDPSPNLRKKMQRFLNSIPDRRPRRDSTPLSELKRKLWDKICPPKNELEQPVFDMQDDESTSGSVDDHLQQLNDLITASGGLRDSVKRKSTIPVDASDVKDSQPNTIGWDDCMSTQHTQPQKPASIFMFTGLDSDVRQSMTAKLESIGVTVVELGSFDPNCTHLICPKPTRNEKILASMAAGKWIIHPSYVDKCLEEGKLVDEEPFEFGNPKSFNNPHMKCDAENEGRNGAIHYWRKEIARRGYGPFHDMKAIVISKKKEPLIRILEAGGAMVLEASPPFTSKIHATHCIVDVKFVSDMSVYIPLAQRGVYCVNTIFINNYLHRTVFDAKDAIIPELAKYF